MSVSQLNSAVRTGDLNSLKRLLSSESPSSSDPTTLGKLLSLACVNGHQDIISFLIEEKSAEVNFLPYDGKTPLMQAVEVGHVAVVKQLVDEYHANVDLMNQTRQTALDIACEEGNAEILQALLAHSENNSEDNMYSLLYKAVDCTHVDVALCLLQKGAKIVCEKYRSSVLSIACRKGNMKLVQILLENGGSAYVNYTGSSQWSPLMEASAGGHTEIIELLLSYDADLNVVDEYGNFPLMLAVRNKYSKTVNLLIKKGANVNQKHGEEGSALIRAIKNTEHVFTDSDWDIVNMLIDGGADVNMEDRNGYTGLLEAIRSKSAKKIVELLLTNGAQVDHQSKSGNFPLRVAIQYEHYEIAELLLQRGANVNLQDSINGYTPLISAASAGKIEFIELLLKHGADINLQDNFGNYALLSAIETQRYEVSKLLLKKGANSDLRRDDGKSAASSLPIECTKKRLPYAGMTLIEINEGLLQKQQEERKLYDPLYTWHSGFQAAEQKSAGQSDKGSGVEITKSQLEDALRGLSRKRSNTETDEEKPAKKPLLSVLDQKPVLCPICEEFIEKISDYIICSGAHCNGQPIHRQCAGLSKKAFEQASKSEFTCSKCECDRLNKVLAMKRRRSSKRSAPRKKFSIIIQGIEECEAGTAMPTRQREDLAKVISVLSKVDGSIQSWTIEDHHRLGKYDQARQRPRPILVQFLRSADVSSILSKTSAVESPYSIQHYMTPTELARNKILLKKRWTIHTETGIDLKLIKIRKHSIFVEDKLHGTLNTNTNQYTIDDTSPDLRGINILYKTKIAVTNSPQIFHWEEYGLKLNIPAQSLPDDIKTCEISIAVSLSGQ